MRCSTGQTKIVLAAWNMIALGRLRSGEKEIQEEAGETHEYRTERNSRRSSDEV